MARNLREGSLGQVNVRVTTDVSGGYVHTEGGITGVAVTDAAAGEVVALDRRPYVHYLFGKADTTAAPSSPAR
jgi:predicted RecA/RadA family phage recombinase